MRKLGIPMAAGGMAANEPKRLKSPPASAIR